MHNRHSSLFYYMLIAIMLTICDCFAIESTEREGSGAGNGSDNLVMRELEKQRKERHDAFNRLHKDCDGIDQQIEEIRKSLSDAVESLSVFF